MFNAFKVFEEMDKEYAKVVEKMDRDHAQAVEEMKKEHVKAVEEITDFDEKTNQDYDEEKKEALKQLREVNVFADKLLSVINEARDKGWYRIELGYLKVNKEGLVGDGRIINTRDMVFKTGERIWHLIAPATQW